MKDLLAKKLARILVDWIFAAIYGLMFFFITSVSYKYCIVAGLFFTQLMNIRIEINKNHSSDQKKNL